MNESGCGTVQCLRVGAVGFEGGDDSFPLIAGKLEVVWHKDV